MFAQSQVCQNLCLVDRHQLHDGFYFYDKLPFDNEVHLIAAVQSMPSVFERQRHLTIIDDPVPRLLESKAFFIRRFEQPRTKLPVHSDCSPNDPPRQIAQWVSADYDF